MVSLFYARHFPAGREVNPGDQPVPNDTLVSDANGLSSTSPPPSSTPVPSPTPSLLHDRADPASSSPQPTQTDHFVPSSALNNPQTLGTDVTLASSSTIGSTPDLPAPSTVSSSASTLQPTPTAALTQGEALSTGSSNNKKYIIGGAVGGGVLVLILLALLLFCCRKRRAERGLERSGGGHSEGELGYGQFACCNHGICSRNNGKPQMEQKSPLKPFVLKSDSVGPTPKEGQQRYTIPLKRRDSTESHKSAGSDTSSSYSSDSEGSQHGRRRSQKRPPPLKLTSLITPVINGPQNNPRQRVDRASVLNPHEIPTIIAEPPRSATQTG